MTASARVCVCEEFQRILLRHKMQPKENASVIDVLAPIWAEAGEGRMDKLTIMIALAGFITIGAMAAILPI
ncbi:hypothetical protein [Methylocystis sp. JR02]|uniref:hypothetical protein n=1 Tax=Methylocystis sp. JR02 TaxID=3046284 RepID=UPI0024BA0ED8|nr:hypothetical protein [Methylocystis sp. JR02]MDJ0447569.1 hypothetical protein [Methylocystis sp. JR02]